MTYRGFYIDETEAEDVLRPTETGSERCEGIRFGLFADYGYSIPLDDFIGAYGHEIDNSEESREQFVKSYIDRYYAEYKEQQFYALLKKDYEEYIFDVKDFEEDFDIVEDAEMIANMKRAYECIKDFKGITLEEMEYLVTVRRPLESVCDQFVLDKQKFIEDFSKCIKQAVKDEVGSYGKIEDCEDTDEKILDDIEPDQNTGMTMQ